MSEAASPNQGVHLSAASRLQVTPSVMRMEAIEC
jgi:hypothetical protein